MVDQDALTKKFQKEMNAGIASLVLLSVMGQAEEPMYGYQVAKLLEDHSQETPMMKQGALYPVLRSLEGLVSHDHGIAQAALAEAGIDQT